MKRKHIPAFLGIIAGLLVLGFCIRLGVDYFKYYVFGSAPFYVYVIERFLEFIILAIACAAAAVWLKKKNKK